MHLSHLATAALVLAPAVLATGPSGGRGGWGGWGGRYGSKPCLNVTTVSELVNGYTYLLEQPGGADFNSTADAILSDSFVVYSDSILTLSNRPVSARAKASTFQPTSFLGLA